MRIFKGKLNIDFMGKRKFAVILSSLMIVISVASLVTRGLNLGVDFTGGTLIEVGYPEPAKLDAIRTVLSDSGFEQAQAQHFALNLFF